MVSLSSPGCANCARKVRTSINKNLRKSESLSVCVLCVCLSVCVCVCVSVCVLAALPFKKRKPVLKYVTVLQELLHTKIQLCITCFFLAGKNWT